MPRPPASAPDVPHVNAREVRYTTRRARRIRRRGGNPNPPVDGSTESDPVSSSDSLAPPVPRRRRRRGRRGGKRSRAHHSADEPRTPRPTVCEQSSCLPPALPEASPVCPLAANCKKHHFKNFSQLGQHLRQAHSNVRFDAVDAPHSGLLSHMQPGVHGQWDVPASKLVQEEREALV